MRASVPRHPSSSITLIGVPLEAGAGRGGCLMGPAALRTAGLRGALEALGHAVEDAGDIRPALVAPSLSGRLAGARQVDEVAAFVRPLAVAVHDAASGGRVPVVLGGDHALAMGSVAGMARHAREAGRPFFVLWLDAHADFNTPETSPSGNLHGMPLAFLCGEPGFEGFMDGVVPVAPGHVHLFGIRSIDRAERDLVLDRGIDVVDMRDIDELGVVVPLRRILDRVAQAGGILHVGFDVDVLDPALAPGVGTLVPGGATYREAHLVMEMLHESGLVAALDLVELNPFLDDRGTTARLLVDLAASLFGRSILDRRNAVRPFTGL